MSEALFNCCSFWNRQQSCYLFFWSWLWKVRWLAAGEACEMMAEISDFFWQFWILRNGARGVDHRTCPTLSVVFALVWGICVRTQILTNTSG